MRMKTIAKKVDGGWVLNGAKNWITHGISRIMSRKYGEQSFKESDKSIDLGDEMADVLFVLMCLANQCGVDLERSLTKNLEKKTKRDQDRHRNNPKLS